MNGILLIDKPKGITSRDVINQICKTLNTKKVGHTGTLDPLATGVMVVCIGKYTKLVEILTNYNKTYEAEIILGTLTDTLDITGNVIKEENVHIEKERIINTLKNFECEYEQEVPIYSAVRIDGKRLYEYARSSIDIKLPKRKVKICSIELISDIKYENNKTVFKIRCDVSKGTYIRSLINDIALSLNTIGIMNELRRIKQGNFVINDCYNLDDVKNNKYKLVDENIIFQNFNIIDVDEVLYNKIKNGSLLKNKYNTDKVVFRYNGNFISIYKEYDKDKNLIKPWKML